MDGSIKPFKPTKKVQSNISKFEQLSLNDAKKQTRNTTNTKRTIIEIDDSDQQEDLLKPIHTTTTKPSTTHPNSRLDALKKRRRHDSAIFLQHSYLSDAAPKSLVDDAREILKSQPCHEDLKAVLEYLQYGIDGRHEFHVRVTGPKSAQIVHVLVTATVPDVWPNLDQKVLSADEAQMKKTILACLSSPVGIGALLSHLRQLSSTKPADLISPTIEIIVAVIADILTSQKTARKFLEQCAQLYANNDMQRNMAWQGYVKQLAGGQIIGTVAQALARSQTSEDLQKRCSWLAKGSEYSIWLAKNVVFAAVKLQPAEVESWKFLSQLFRRGLSLGHRDVLVAEVYKSLLLGQRALWTPLHQLLQQLPMQEQRTVLDEVLHDLSKTYLNEIMSVESVEDDATRKAIAGAAALLSGIVKHNKVLRDHLESWLVVANASHAAVGLASRRALIAVLAEFEGTLDDILAKSLSNFSDKLQIQHSSMLQQEACAQTILLVIGRLHRSDPSSLKRTHISSLVMRSVSNRLAASVPRARLLGMVIGVAFSKLVDEPDKVLNFDLEDMNGIEAVKLLQLPAVDDTIGSISDLPPISTSKIKNRPARSIQTVSKPTPQPVQPQTSKIIAIEEISDSETSEDDDLIPYQKPDSDPDDSDEDPTLIDRSKPSAPVYIVDLVKQLNRTDQLETIESALKAAPSLIRRKIGFGTELSDNIHSLATTLINLQEGMSDPDLQQLRVDSLIACVVAGPEALAPSLTKLYFDGDFSMSQRIVILTALALGSREISGFKDETSPQKPINTTPLFPSKRLPPHLEPSLPSSTPNPIDALSLTAARSTIQPMALAAADTLTGPSVLKIRHFSSRMSVQKQRDLKSQARTKLIPKNLHLILTNSFFLPLCSRLALLTSYSSNINGSTATLLQPFLLKICLQTLTLHLHTLGPLATTHLPTLTSETLTLLTPLSVSPRSTDPLVLPAVLHLFLTLLNLTIEAGVSAQERLVVDHGKSVAALVGWANRLSDTAANPDADGGEGNGVGMPWSVLAAGVQVKWFEIGRQFQGRVMGLSVDGGEFGGS